MKIRDTNSNMERIKELQIDCSLCSGLCCTALFFSKAEGFPENKAAGEPCIHLGRDFKCSIHDSLSKRNMKGCIRYDCFGAGQKVTQSIDQGETWLSTPEKAGQIYAVFHIVYQLHQILWLLVDARTVISAEGLWHEIDMLIDENDKICSYSTEVLLTVDLRSYKGRAKETLKQVGAAVKKCYENSKELPHHEYLGGKYRGVDFSGADLSMKLLIAADFSCCNFSGANFFGTDIRDANFDDADLRNVIFLTQAQVNSARGNANTLLPSTIMRPVSWKKYANDKEN